MARAIYQDADIYLLDDPISALDGYVSEKVFSSAILGLKNYKTVIMVTNNKSLMGYFDRVFELEYSDQNNFIFESETQQIEKSIELSGTELRNLRTKRFASVVEKPTEELDQLRTSSIRIKT